MPIAVRVPYGGDGGTLRFGRHPPRPRGRPPALNYLNRFPVQIYVFAFIVFVSLGASPPNKIIVGYIVENTSRSHDLLGN